MQNLATIFSNINFQPVQTAVEHNEIHTKPSRDTMQPMISAGKLFEPAITSSKKTMSENLKEEEILEPNPSSSRKSSILKNKQNGSHRRLQRRVSYENEEAISNISEEQMKTMDIDELVSVVESKPSAIQHEINEDSDDVRSFFLEIIFSLSQCSHFISLVFWCFQGV